MTRGLSLSTSGSSTNEVAIRTIFLTIGGESSFCAQPTLRCRRKMRKKSKHLGIRSKILALGLK
jgi:hypothetical protein